MGSAGAEGSEETQKTGNLGGSRLQKKGLEDLCCLFLGQVFSLSLPFRLEFTVCLGLNNCLQLFENIPS